MRVRFPLGAQEYFSVADCVYMAAFLDVSVKNSEWGSSAHLFKVGDKVSDRVGDFWILQSHHETVILRSCAVLTVAC